MTIWKNKKVLLRERKRHTTRHVAIAISCYSGGGGGPLTKMFFPSLNMYQAKSGVKNFFLCWDQVPPPENLRPPPTLKIWDPPQVWIDTQSENITSRHPSDAGGNKQVLISWPLVIIQVFNPCIVTCGILGTEVVLLLPLLRPKCSP